MSPIRRTGKQNAPEEAFPSGAHNVYGYQNCNSSTLTRCRRSTTPSPQEDRAAAGDAPRGRSSRTSPSPLPRRLVRTGPPGRQARTTRASPSAEAPATGGQGPARGRRGTPALPGRRVPDVRLREGRLYEALRAGRFVLITPRDTEAGHDERFTVAHWASERRLTLLVRPGGYAAWASEEEERRREEGGRRGGSGVVNTLLRPPGRRGDARPPRRRSPLSRPGG
ncbi:hypothetical protein [Streptomyces enissocaesilis]|uniref:aromatic-ring hydroxylase C-terminal domain-containing protein n=1 Tax=Streptomyces enissocaesilis TaxID=332589 RepID=UPI003CD0AD55